MPVFKTQPSSSLTNSVARMVASNRTALSPLQQVQATREAARTAHDMSLAEKARQEVADAQEAAALRADPNTATEYASHVAGVDLPVGASIMDAVRGKMVEPGPGDIQDADVVGATAQPYQSPMPVLQPGQEGAFRGALASLIANRLATGKTNAQQLTAAGGNLQNQALTAEAARTPDIPAANTINAAVAHHIQLPFKTNTAGVTTNEATGTRDETGTIAQATLGHINAQTATEGARRTERLAAGERNRASAGLSNERATAVRRGLTDKGQKRIAPEQVVRWASEQARREWDSLGYKGQKAYTAEHPGGFKDYMKDVQDRFNRASGPGQMSPAEEIQAAHNAIAKGKDPAAVRALFQKRMGFTLPSPSSVAEPTSGGDGEGED